MTTKRLFVAIDFPQSLAAKIADLAPEIRGVRAMEIEQMHLTLGFFGDVPAELDLALREKLNAISFHAFFLPASGIGTFPSKGSPNVIWIGLGAGHPHLFQLHKRVQEAALAVGLEADLRPWHPHITIARCRDLSQNELKPFLRKHGDFDAGMFRVEEFHLYSSRLTPAGSIHTRELTVLAR